MATERFAPRRGPFVFPQSPCRKSTPPTICFLCVKEGVVSTTRTLPHVGASQMSEPEDSRELRMARFADIYDHWTRRQITQTHAARLLGISDRTFRRYAVRYRRAGLKGLADGRLRSRRRASSDEIARVKALYTDHYAGWSVRAFVGQYRLKHGGTRSYSWVKSRLQEAGLVPKRGGSVPTDVQRCARRPAEGMLLFQRRSAFQWSRGQMSELLLTIDDASLKVYSGFLTRGESTWSRFRGIHEVLVQRLFLR